jgi:hypothetical protein
MKSKRNIPYALVIFLIGCFPFFFWGGPGYFDYGRVLIHSWNLGHVLFFALFSYLVHLAGSPLFKDSFLVQCLLVLMAALLLGALIEVAQHISNGRRALDVEDMQRNLIGAALFLFYLSPERKSIAPAIRHLLQVLTMGLILVQLYPVAAAGIDDWMARKQFPVLSDFERSVELGRWVTRSQVKIHTGHAIHGNASLRLKVRHPVYETIQLKHFPQNWQGYRKLQFSVFNPSPQNIKLTCKVYDQPYDEARSRRFDSFVQTFEVGQGWRTIDIDLMKVATAPRGRLMDLSQIDHVRFVFRKINKVPFLGLDHVRLIE